MRAAEERAWEVVKRAYAERTPMTSSRLPNRRLTVALTVVTLGAIVAAVLSPPGRAVFHRMREAVGVEDAAPALFSLPTHGRLLVVSTGHGGVWLVRDNGLKRRLGSYNDAEWSPHGRFLVATTANELVALDPEGDVRWTLARRDPAYPRWEGTSTDTRIAYVSASGLRVVAGDGTGDTLIDRFAKGVPPAWDPTQLQTLAYYSRGAIILRDTGSGRLEWRTRVTDRPTDLEWSSDGRRLAVVSPKRILVLDATGHVRRTVSMLGARLVEGAFAPGSHRLAVVVRMATHSEVRTLDVDNPGRAKLLFAGPGVFADVAWSPDANWLLVAWPTADQWVFLHGARAHAVANIKQQFPRADHRGPTLQLAGRWCC
jgi:WD40 repeat protein